IAVESCFRTPTRPRSPRLMAEEFAPKSSNLRAACAAEMGSRIATCVTNSASSRLTLTRYGPTASALESAAPLESTNARQFADRAELTSAAQASIGTPGGRLPEITAIFRLAAV